MTAKFELVDRCERVLGGGYAPPQKKNEIFAFGFGEF